MDKNTLRVQYFINSYIYKSIAKNVVIQYKYMLGGTEKIVLTFLKHFSNCFSFFAAHSHTHTP